MPSLRRAGHAVRFTDIAIDHSGYVDPALRLKKLERNLRLLHLDLAERPHDAFTLFNLGWAFADLGRAAEAIPLLQRSLRQSHPADSITLKLFALLTLCHRRLGQHEQAWAVCQAGQVRCPDDAELLFLKGQLCRQRDDGAGARRCWMQLLADAPHPQPLSPLRGERGERSIPHPSGERGECGGWRVSQCRCGFAGTAGAASPGRARPRGRTARRGREPLANPAGPDASFRSRSAGTGRTVFATREINRRGKSVKRIANAGSPRCRPVARPTAPGSLGVRRRSLAARRDHRQAPHVLPAAILLSHVLLQSGDESAAEPLLRSIVERDAGQAESWRNLAVLYRRHKRLREAIATAQAGRLHCPHDGDLLLLHGVLLHEGGDVVNAEPCLLRVLESEAVDAPACQRRLTARRHLIALYRALSRHREATAQEWAAQSDHSAAAA